MLGWGALALAIAAVADRFLRRHAFGSAESAAANIEDSAARWVRITGILAVLLSSKAAWHGDHLWAAAAITCASLAGAWVAILLQHKGWAFASGLGANAAVSLIAWHFHASLLLLLQANLIASATIALLWLAVRRQFSPKQHHDAAPWIDYLSVQVGISLLGNACLVISVLAIVVWDPSPNRWPPFLQQIGSAWGWLALVLSVVPEFGIWGSTNHNSVASVMCIRTCIGCAGGGFRQPVG